MSKYKVTNGNIYGEFIGVSNTIYIEMNEDEFDQSGSIIGKSNQHIFFDAYSKEFIDFVKTINEINKFVNE